MSIILKATGGILVSVLAAVPAGRAVAQGWIPPTCGLKAGHYLVNSAVLYLKSASTTQFADQKTRDLKDANRVLNQALTSGGQQKNPAAWYYLGRYYVLQQDLVGADSAFTQAAQLAPGCKADIEFWRRALWGPVFNAGVQAWQAGNTDSAIATFRRANQIYTIEPTGFTYLGTLFANANQPDSAAKYFKLALPAAADQKYAKERRDALFNVARVYHAAQRWDDAAAAYREYLAIYPSDVQALAGLAVVLSRSGKRGEALALYGQILDHADSANAQDLFAAGRAIFEAVPSAPDTAQLGGQCRSEARSNRALTVRQIAARCDSVTSRAMQEFNASAASQYRLVAKAYEAGLAKNPYDREALYTLAGTSYLLGDTARMKGAAQWLLAVDPLNRESLRMVAQFWQLKGKGDSTLHYLRIADSLPLGVTVGTFTPDDQGALLEGLFTNARSKPSAPATVTFEFLNAKGDVVASKAQDVPSIEAGGNQAFTIKVQGAEIAAWRYRKS